MTFVYYHRDFSAICSALGAQNLKVWRQSVSGVDAPEPASIDDIANMMQQSEVLWGTALPWYLVASKTDQLSCSLEGAVSQIGEGDLTTVLFVAYQDGGLISVSAVAQPFHQNAVPASWWRPWSS
ncbi:hypothetical protein ACJ4V0_09785 [Phreatobacter sp. HK31-P]